MSNSKILVLESDRALRTSRTSILSQEGYEVTGVSGIEEAVRIAGQEQYDLLVISIEQPELLKMLLSRFPRSAGVLMIVSNASAAPAVAESVESGIYRLLVQPVSNVRLKSAAAEIIERVGIIRDSFRSDIYTEMARINAILASDSGTDDFYGRILKAGLAGTGADYSSLVLYEQAGRQAAFRTHLGTLSAGCDEVLDLASSLDEPTLLTASTRHHRKLAQAMARSGISSLLCVPLGSEGNKEGMMTLIREADRSPFTLDDVYFVSTLAC
jgi:CheY-like chemotaxis protein